MSEENDYQAVSVHAGFPNPAADMSLHGLDLNKLLIAHSASTYFFRVRGTEWQEAGVFDGDIAIVDRGITPRKTDTIVWWNEADGEFGMSTLSRLRPNAAVWGVITATIHQFRQDS